MYKIIVLVMTLLLLTSCWDITEVEQVGFVMGVAIDPLSEEELKEYQKQFKKETGERARDMYRTTYQVVIPSMIVQEGAKLGDKAFFNISTVGRTSFNMNRQIAARRSRALNYEHLKVIIINQELMKTGELAKFIDLYIRDHEMRRETFVFITKGNAMDALESKLPLETMPVKSITMIQENYLKQDGVPKPKPIGELLTAIIDKKSFIIPRITPREGKDLAIKGAAIFLGESNELLGWLGAADIAAYNLVVDEVGNQVIEVDLDKGLFVFETDNFDSDINYHLKEGQDFFEINLKAEGLFVDSWLDDIELGEAETNKKLQAAVAKELQQQATEIVKKMQDEFKADIFEFSKVIKKKNYPRWQEIKDQWDGEEGYFAKANISINAEVKIRHHMTIEQLK